MNFAFVSMKYQELSPPLKNENALVILDQDNQPSYIAHDGSFKQLGRWIPDLSNISRDRIIQHGLPSGLETWVRLASLGNANPTSMGELLDIERRRQIGILGKIFNRRKYSKYNWTVYIIAAMSELQKEGHESVSIGMIPITPRDISRWSSK